VATPSYGESRRNGIKDVNKIGGREGLDEDERDGEG
jgi:hypothetical protein